MDYTQYLKNGVYVSPHNNKEFATLRSFSAHLRNMRADQFWKNNTNCSCIFCKTETSITNIKRHTDNCYLNPSNLKSCQVCQNPIKNFRTNKTCSYSCSNTLFRSGPNNPNWKDESYTTTCFHYHKKECVVCGEDKIVAVHHFDENHNNNAPENLIPLCPTHHAYWHSQYKHLVEQKVLDYISAWATDNT